MKQIKLLLTKNQESQEDKLNSKKQQFLEVKNKT